MSSPPPRADAVPTVRPLWIGPLRIDPPVLQAPMAGFTNWAFRQMVRQLGGAGLLAAEMVSARSLFHRNARGQGDCDRLWGVREEPRPLAVQVWDNDPGLLASVAARLVEEYRPSVIDINFGCPVRDVSEKAQSGSYLLRYPERIGAIVARVAAACSPTPVTSKIRLGSTRDTINAIDVAQAIEGAGGAAVTIHGRTAADLFRGTADWDEISRVKPYLKRVPLIGNGDLRTAESVVEVLRRYDVDGVMIGRAALARPWLFRQTQTAVAGQPVPPEPTPTQQREWLLDHYRRVVDRFGPERGTILMRRFACSYAPGHPGVRQFRAGVSLASTPAEFVAAVDRYFAAWHCA